MNDNNPKPSPKMVRCPQCGGPSLFGADNPFRPFCNERCQLIDLGMWANGDYKIPVNAAPEEDLSQIDIDEE